MNFQVGRAGGSFTALGSDSACVLARILRSAALQGEGEGVAFAGNLDPVCKFVIKGLVVSEPGSCDTSARAGNSLKCGIFSSYKEVNF